MINNWKLWLEEFQEINKEVNKEKYIKETARRLLVFTEGFMFKVISTSNEEIQSKDVQEIISKIRNENLESMRIQMKQKMKQKIKENKNG